MTAEIEVRIERTRTQVLALVEEGKRAAAIYDEFVTRAAGGETIPESEWCAVEERRALLARRAMRLSAILRHQHAEMASHVAPQIAEALEQAARNLVALIPAAGNA